MRELLIVSVVLLWTAASGDVNLAEFLGVGAALVLSVAFSKSIGRRCWRVERGLARIGRRAVLSIALAACLGPGLRLAMLPVYPAPQPGIVDEYSHLLLADTLAQGRLTNPTHPLWPHFESIHAIQGPTYNSMYMPGQGFFLALGQATTGQPWAGVVLSVALLCGAICWMLRGWMPPGWALLGGLIVSIRLGVFSYWMNSYWGGAVGALGGALVLGAWGRLRRSGRLRDSFCMACGLGMLMFTRPFEGLALAVPVAAGLLIWPLRRSARERLRRLWRIGAPVLLTVGVFGVLLCGYFWRVTGSPWRPPYVVNQQTYGWPLTLAWHKPPQIDQRHEELRRYYAWELDQHAVLLSPLGRAYDNMASLVPLWAFFFGPALTLPVVLSPRLFRDRRIRPALLASLCVFGAVLVEQSRYPHYLGPATAGLALIWLQGLRHLRAAGRRSPKALALARLIPLVVVFAVVCRAAVGPSALRFSLIGQGVSWCCSTHGPLERPQIVAQLERIPGRHLVIVRYKPGNGFFEAWVHNLADIDGARIVWAQELGPAENRRLLAYFKDRTAWLVEADEKPPRLSPYPAAADHGPSTDRPESR
jgi:hypothetical protein